MIYGYDQGSDLVLFNNREILVDNKTVHLNNWVENDVISIKDLLKDNGNYLSLQEFTEKFSCKTNFLQYYQIISAILNHLILKARQVDFVNKEYFTSNDLFFILTAMSESNWTKQNHATFTNCSLIKLTKGATLVPKERAKTCL